MSDFFDEDEDVADEDLPAETLLLRKRQRDEHSSGQLAVTGNTKRKVSAEFDFVRRLKGMGHKRPEDCEEQVKTLCQVSNLPFDDFWILFNLAWPQVKYPNYGRDGFAWAVEKAVRQPVLLGITPPTPAKHYVLVVSIAFYLLELTEGNPFLLPGKKLSTVVGVHVSTISAILKWLKANGVIRCVNESYWFGPGIASANSPSCRSVRR